jgi:hypothetical protein
LSRLIYGVDRGRLKRYVQDAELLRRLDFLEYVIPAALFTLQDAVDFGAFAVRTTIAMQRFSAGVDSSDEEEPAVASCGGPTQIAANTKHGGFEWVDRLELKGAPWFDSA